MPQPSSRLRWTAEIQESVADEQGNPRGCYVVDVICAGFTLNKDPRMGLPIYYPAETLRESVGLFDGLPVCLHYPGDDAKPVRHMPRSLRQGAGREAPADTYQGFTRAAEWRDSPGPGRIVALLECTEGNRLRKDLDRAEQFKVRPLGLSIDVDGTLQEGVAEGRPCMIVTELTAAYETAAVSRPAARGKVVRLVAGVEEEEETVPNITEQKNWVAGRRKQLVDRVAKFAGKKPVVAHKGAAVLQEDVPDSNMLDLITTYLSSDPPNLDGAQDIIDTLKQSKTGDCPDTDPAAVPSPDDGALMMGVADERPLSADTLKRLDAFEARQAERERKAAERDRQVALQESVDLVEGLIKTNKLQPTFATLARSRFAGQVVLKEDADKYITELREAMVASHPQSQTLPAGSAGRAGHEVRTIYDEREVYEKRMELMWGYDPNGLQPFDPKSNYTERVKVDKSELQMYRELQESSNQNRPKHLGIMAWGTNGSAEGRGTDAVLQEDVNANYPNILSNTMGKVVQQMFDSETKPYLDFFNIRTDINDWKAHPQIILGGYSPVQQIAEGPGNSSLVTTYPYLQQPSEIAGNVQVSRFGGLVAITDVMWDNDDLGEFRQVPAMISAGCLDEQKRYAYRLKLGNQGMAGINTDTMYDGGVLFSVAHGNVTNSPLAFAPLMNAYNILRSRREFGYTYTLTAAYTAGTSTTITLNTTNGLIAGRSFFQVDGEVFLVTAVNSGTVVAVTGSQLGTSDANHSSGASALSLLRTIPVTKFQCLVPTQKSGTLDQTILAEWLPQTNYNDKNPLYNLQQKGALIPYDEDPQYLGGNIFNWFMFAHPSQLPGCWFAWKDDQRTPRVLVQKDPLTGNVFFLNQQTVKTDHVYGGLNLDWRPSYAGITTS